MIRSVPEVFECEYLLMKIVWDSEPVRMRKLVADAYEVKQWKRTTVYTMIKRLSERGIVTFKDGFVTSNYSQNQVQMSKAVEFIDKTYDGSISELMSAFVDKKEIDKKEALEIKELLDKYIGE